VWNWGGLIILGKILTCIRDHEYMVSSEVSVSRWICPACGTPGKKERIINYWDKKRNECKLLNAGIQARLIDK